MIGWRRDEPTDPTLPHRRARGSVLRTVAMVTRSLTNLESVCRGTVDPLTRSGNVAPVFSWNLMNLSITQNNLEEKLSFNEFRETKPTDLNLMRLKVL